MKKIKQKIIITIILLIALIGIINTANATETLNQDNITNTVNGGILVLEAGVTYKLDADSDSTLIDGLVIEKKITIRSSSLSENAIIDLGKQGRAFNINQAGSLTLINITIKNGQASDGAAIQNYRGTLTATGCNFTDNTATNTGGAIYNYADSTFTSTVNITGCIFTGNTATNGGGAIYNYAGSTSNSTVNIAGCNFTDNTAIYNGGGAIRNFAATGSTATVNITGCNFTGNTATNNYGGGAIYTEASGTSSTATVNIAGCIFTGNTATNNGGAICNYAGSTSTSTVNITGCIFTGNKANTGGAIFNYAGSTSTSTVNLAGCNFTGNTATYNGGGAIYNYADSTSTSTVNIAGCNFTDNTAIYNGGGAIRNFAATGSTSTVNIAGCNFTGNTATYNYGGGAIYTEASGTSSTATVNITGCIFTGNTATNNGSAIYNYAGSTSTSTSTVNITGCTFTDNKATNNGATICNFAWNSGNPTVTVTGCAFDSIFFPIKVYTGNDEDNIILKNVIHNNVIRATTEIVGTSSVSGVGLDGFPSVDVTVDVLGIYWIVIDDIFTGYVTFTDFTQELAVNYDLDISKSPYTVEVYNNPGGVLLVSGTITVVGKIVPTLVVSSVSGALNSEVDLKATLTSGGSPIDNEEIIFWDSNGDEIGRSVTGPDGVATVKYTIKSLSDTYYAEYEGNDKYKSKKSDSGTITGTKKAADTSNSLDSSNNLINHYSGPTMPISPFVSQLNYNNLLKIIDSVAKLDSKKYSPASWNSLKKALANARNMNKAKKAKSQAEIDAVDKALKDAKSKLTKRDADLQITKVKRSGNSYKITIKNFGKDVSTKTRLKIAASDKYVKTTSVKAIAAGKSITLTVKFFKYSQTRSFNKNIHLNFNREATETNYKNNKFKIPKN